jgi:putative DNA primase/helicase
MATATKTLDQLRRAYPDGQLSGDYYHLPECPHCGKTGAKKCSVRVEADGITIGGVSCFHNGGDHNSEATAKLYAAIDSGAVTRSTVPAKSKRKSLDNTTASWGWPDKWEPITEATRAILAASRPESYTPRLETLLARGFRERKDKTGRIRFAYPVNLDGELQFCKAAFADIREGESRRKWPQFAPTTKIPTNLLFGIDEAFPARVWVPSMVLEDGNRYYTGGGEWKESIPHSKAPAVFITEGQWDALVLHELGYPAVAIGCDKQTEIAPELVERLLQNAQRVYLVPDKGAESTMDHLALLFPPERCFIVEMRAAKDISELRQNLAEVEPSWVGDAENLTPIRTAIDEMVARKRTGKATEPERVSLDASCTLTRMSDYTPTLINWLWAGRVPENKLIVWAGEVGSAKSQSTYSLIAAVTNGVRLPDDPSDMVRKPADVMICFCEDDAEDTVTPRLMAAGADTSRVYKLEMTFVAENGSKSQREAALDSDLPKMEKMLAEHPSIRLLIIDPLSNYTGKVKLNDEQTMRTAILVPLRDLAKKYGVTVICVCHLNKRSDVNALNRVLGAGAITGVARACWLFAADEEAPEDECDHFVMCDGKGNLTRKALRKGLKYHTAEKQLTWPDGRPVLDPDTGKQISASYVVWDGQHTMSADDALDTVTGHKAEKAVRKAEASAFLRTALSGGPRYAEDVKAEATNRKISAKTLQRAREALGVKHGKEIGVQDGRSMWWLAEKAGERMMMEETQG